MRSSKLKQLSLIAVLVPVFLFGANAHGQANNARLATCSISSQGLAFGTYRPNAAQQAALNSTSTITLSCTCTGNGTVSFSGSTHIGGANNAARTLSSTPAGSSLSYGVYSNVARTVPYANAENLLPFSATGTCPQGNNNNAKPLGFASPPQFVIYGSLPDVVSNKNARAGTYSGTLSFTVTY